MNFEKEFFSWLLDFCVIDGDYQSIKDKTKKLILSEQIELLCCLTTYLEGLANEHKDDNQFKIDVIDLCRKWLNKSMRRTFPLKDCGNCRRSSWDCDLCTRYLPGS